jgi:phenylacetate-CoA ligase
MKTPNFPRLLYYLVKAMRRVYWDPDKMRTYQEKQLRSVVQNAYKYVPFYNKKFKELKITPTDIKNREDLTKLPILTKDELRRENPARLISTGFDIKKLKVVKTSGSTGQPLRIYLNRAEDDWRKAIYMRANISCGQKPRDRWAVITAPHHFLDTTNIQRILRVYAQTCVSVFSSLNEQVRLVSEADPDVLDGYSGSILLFAKEVERRELKTIRPRIIFGTADLIDFGSRRFIEEVFEAPFYDQFGCGELDRTAWQCPEKREYHIDEDSVIMEFVDKNGEEVSAGERGEILYTSLFNYAQPLIRYAVGDVGIPVEGECPCGRKLPLMKVVEGRSDSFLVLGDGRVLSPMAFWTIMRLFKYTDHIDKFRVVQRESGLIEIYVKKENTNIGEDFLETKLVEHIEKCLHIEEPSSITFNVRFVEEIPLDKSGKLRSVISLLKQSH